MASSRGRWVPIMLVASLAVNVFVLGAFAAHWFAISFSLGGDSRDALVERLRRSQAHPGIVVGLPSPTSILQVLHEDEREHLMTKWRAANPELREGFKRLYDARDEVADVLSEPAYKRVDLENAFADLRARQMELASTSQGLIIDLADNLDADGRNRLAHIMRPPPERRGEKLRPDLESSLKRELSHEKSK
jgi:uncharacterized membrane protein